MVPVPNEKQVPFVWIFTDRASGQSNHLRDFQIKPLLSAHQFYRQAHIV
ncbi:MAG: hypothetical protein ACI9KK_001147 [Ascidiaceihabitans sp.]|jgi:hypothetical protein